MNHSSMFADREDISAFTAVVMLLTFFIRVAAIVDNGVADT